MTGQLHRYEPDTARAWVDVDLGALVRNGARLAHHAGAPLLPMVKADAYGLGVLPVARALERVEPWAFGVGTVAEGRELRVAGIARRIVVFTPLLRDELPAAHDLGLTPSLHRAADIEQWGAYGAPWHLSIDSGMNRAGVRWDRVDELAAAIRRHPPEGAYTHFHSADIGGDSRDRQEERFRAALRQLPARPAVLHADNSPSLERRGPSPWNVARPGVFLYGLGSGGALVPEDVVTVRARVVDLRDVGVGESVSYGASWCAAAPRRIATLAVGYGDGYRRALSNRGTVLLRGQPVPVVGRVTMDMTMVDVTDVACEIGDLATLIGRDGDRRLSVADVAAAGDLLGYEVLTGLRGRLPRRYAPASADDARGVREA